VKIVWTRQALGDLASALDCAACEKPAATVWVAETIEKSVDSLLQNPEMGRPGRVKDTRELIVPGTPLLISYSLQRGQVFILAFFMGLGSGSEFLKIEENNL
jgi:toxin ParE1/3/4